tara:strand:- start:3493 stop:4692 length:1200 start_codon:yes stop_codon:yes gene_type:complete
MYLKKKWINRVENARNKSLIFAKNLKCDEGYKYTVNHDVNKYPAALLYGTWSNIYIKHLLLGEEWKDNIEKKQFLNILNSFRNSDGIFFPESLNKIKFSKSLEYLKLHCYNYSVGAALLIDKDYDFNSSYMDEFLGKKFLERWLDQRSLQRPWEESNNIVNVASYLALCSEKGNKDAEKRLKYMLDWHNKNQNPKTGGFEIFSPTRKNFLQSMAGSVHNFHIHHYLNKPIKYEKIIANNLIPFLYEGPLTACLSIDFVELACTTIHHVENKYELGQALLFHLDNLLNYQNDDGGWFENEVPRPTTANGMKENIASSNSYATWFRMCSIAMIMITLFDEKKFTWNFRNTLGMGYVNNNIQKLKFDDYSIDNSLIRKNKLKNFPYKIKDNLIILASKYLKF